MFQRIRRWNPLVAILVFSAVASVVMLVAGKKFHITQQILEDDDGGVSFQQPFQMMPFDGQALVGVLDIEGVILDSYEVLEVLKNYEENKSIKGILIRVNSPGGAVAPSQEIYDQLIKLRAVKPVVVHMGSVAASGGYYIAAGAQKIVAEKGTLTGSIGVIVQMSYLEQLYKFLKIEPFVIKAGKFKDVGNPGRRMTPEERKILQDMVDETHRQFQEAVARGRGLPLEYVKTFADGRIFTGETAKSLGLVDELGNMDDAVQVVAKLAKITKPKLVYPQAERFRFMKEFFKASIGGFATALQKWNLLPASLQGYGLGYMWDGGRP